MNGRKDEDRFTISDHDCGGRRFYGRRRSAMTAPVSPLARVLAAEKGIDTTALAGSGPGGRVMERDVMAALESRPRPGAAVLGEGKGQGERVVPEDLVAPKAGAESGASATPRRLPRAEEPEALPRAALASFPGPFSDSPVKGIRKIIADRMRQSLQATAQLSYQASAPAARVLELRARMKNSDPALGLTGTTINDLVLFALSRVLGTVPDLNAHLMGGTLRRFDRVHLGMAVDTARGLMVPVIRNADLLSLTQISAEAKRLAAGCLEGRIPPDELSGSTFTVSNLGSLGVEAFTPVLNPPEVAILGVCNIIHRPITREDGSMGLEPRIGLSLTADHQVVDGAPAARFLRALAEALANLDLLIAR